MNKEAIKKYWWIGAILLIVLVLFRPKGQASNTSRLAAVEAQVPTGDGIMEETLRRLAGEEASRAGRMAAAQESLAMQQIDTQKKLLAGQAAYETSILRGQTIIQDRMADKAKSAKFSCDNGTTKIDPETGRLYCRQEKTKGMSIGGQSLFGSGGILNGLNNMISQFIPGLPSGSVFGGGYGTPPIVQGGGPLYG